MTKQTYRANLKYPGDCTLSYVTIHLIIFLSLAIFAVLPGKQTKVLEQALLRAVLVARLNLAHAAYHVALGHQNS
jgi:hypothetical protein